MNVSSLNFNIAAPAGMALTNVSSNGAWFTLRYQDADSCVDVYFNADCKECFRVYMPLTVPTPESLWTRIKKVFKSSSA